MLFTGVVNSKWHTKKKVSAQVRLQLSKTSEEGEFAQRETTFSGCREALCVEFRGTNGKKNIFQICRGFWLDPRHVAGQFTYVTDSPSLNQNIEANFRTFIGRSSLEKNNSYITNLHYNRPLGTLHNGRRQLCGHKEEHQGHADGVRDRDAGVLHPNGPPSTRTYLLT